MIKNREEIKRVLAEPITPMARKPTLNDLPRKLRGPSNNKYGGHARATKRADAPRLTLATNIVAPLIVERCCPAGPISDH